MFRADSHDFSPLDFRGNGSVERGNLLGQGHGNIPGSRRKRKKELRRPAGGKGKRPLFRMERSNHLPRRRDRRVVIPASRNGRTVHAASGIGNVQRERARRNLSRIGDASRLCFPRGDIRPENANGDRRGSGNPVRCPHSRPCIADRFPSHRRQAGVSARPPEFLRSENSVP